jgi:hypothetical protein
VYRRAALMANKSFFVAYEQPPQSNANTSDLKYTLQGNLQYKAQRREQRSHECSIYSNIKGRSPSRVNQWQCFRDRNGQFQHRDEQF